MTMTSLEMLAKDAGLSLEEIKDSTFEEFHAWSKIACEDNVVLRASVFQEWKNLRNENHGEITSLQALCEQAGTTMQEIAALSSQDFRELTKVLNVNSIAQHTLLFQDKKRLSEEIYDTKVRDVSPVVDVMSFKKANAQLMHGEQLVATEQYNADARNDENSRDYQARSSIESARQQDLYDVHQDVASSQDENALLNDVLMCSHKIDPTGNGQLSLEFIWRLANTHHPAIDHTAENEVVFSDVARIGTRRYIKFVKSFRSLYLMSSENDRHVLAGLLVLVAQTRGYRFFESDHVTEDLYSVSDELAKSKTMDILTPRTQERSPLASGSQELLQSPMQIKQKAPAKRSKPQPPSPPPQPFVRGQTRFTKEQDKIIKDEVMNSPDQPYTNWVNLRSKLPMFKSKQLRDRWVNHLNPEIDHSPFTLQEDENLYHAILRHGCRWAAISHVIFNLRRPENKLKNRYNSAKFRRFVVKKYGEAAFNKIDPKRAQYSKHKKEYYLDQEASDDPYREPEKKKKRTKK